MRSSLLCAVLALITIAASATTFTPSLVLAHPLAYDGKVIIVSGTVSGFVTKTTDLGNFTTFSLCDKRCITVIDKKKQSHTDNATATVDGTFHRSFQGQHKTWTNVVLVGF